MAKVTPISYNHSAVEKKWREQWDENPINVNDGEKEKYYCLDMFPYPSGSGLHVGHWRGYVISDVWSRYQLLKGKYVIHPMGWDAFGLPAENYAIKMGVHPAISTESNVTNIKRQIKQIAAIYDWDMEVNTTDPEFYKWTQWIFVQMFKKGLAYEKEFPINWCPSCKTGLANEEVVNGCCERCGTAVTKKNLRQWMLKITAYAERLLNDLDKLDWPEKVKKMQTDWIGKSYGAEVDFPIDGREEKITVYTTRPDTLYGATFMVLAPEHSLAKSLATDETRAAVEQYIFDASMRSNVDRMQAKDKTGVFTGSYCINPLNGAKTPIWLSDYVLADYGTGAVMAVPAHDQRDLDFARKYGIDVIPVIDTGEADPRESGIATTGDGAYQNSGFLDGITTKTEAIEKMCEFLGDKGIGEPTITYRLRDWLLSRQRFWGCPIPIIHCDTCGDVPVPDDQLPVKLPELRGAELAPKGKSPLAGEEAREWREVSCPRCGEDAQRDTDTMDTFVDSSWYFMRYCSPHFDQGPFDTDAVRRWMPVAQYIGGVEHATMHLLYSRFFTKVLHDLGMLDFTEPFQRLMNQGQVINEGRAMSKSLGTGVDLGKHIDGFRFNAVRTTFIFAGPQVEDIDWADVAPASIRKFRQRAWRVASEVTSDRDVDVTNGDVGLRRVTHRSIADITELLDGGRYNVVVARIMELVNATRKAIDSGCGPGDPAVREAVTFTAQALSLVAPYLAEEMWEMLGLEPSVANSQWPTADEKLLVAEEVTMVVQVTGKVRAKIQVSPDITEEQARELALADSNVQRFTEGKEIVKVIARLPKMISIVAK